MSAGTDEFLDTNVLVYAFTTDPRAGAAQGLIARGCVVGVQSLNEFANVARRKLAMTWDELDGALSAIRAVSSKLVAVDLGAHEDALRLARRHGFAIFDALIIAAARSANCSTLWSEDMADGMLIDGRLRIRNPFTPPPAPLR